MSSPWPTFFSRHRNCFIINDIQARKNEAPQICANECHWCDKGPEGPAWTVGKTAQALGVSSRTIEHLKRRFVEQGLDAALRRKPRAVTFDGEFEACLVALACSPAPEGRTRWTVRLLAAKAVEPGLAPRVSPMTVHRILRKQTAS